MKKINALLFVLCLLLCSCTVKEERQGTYTFMDDLNRTVTVDKPQRVAALLASYAQIWQLAGGQVVATADDAWDDLHLELDEDTVNLGNTKSLSMEALLGSHPDFVLASANTRQNVEWKDTLETAGIAVAYFNVGNFEEYMHLLKICTDMTGRSDLYEKNGLAVKKQIDTVIERSRERLAEQEAPKILNMVASASSIHVKNSEDNVLGEMLAAMGYVNIADSETSLLQNLSFEYILQSDPEYIFIVPRGDDTEGMLQNIAAELESNPLWAQLTAVKENRVFIMEKDLFGFKPNHRWGEAYERLEEILTGEE